MKKELTEKERSLLDYICSKYNLDFSGCKARKTKKGHLFVEGGSYVFRIEKKHLELILDSDYRTEDVIVISADRSSVCCQLLGYRITEHAEMYGSVTYSTRKGMLTRLSATELTASML